MIQGAHPFEAFFVRLPIDESSLAGDPPLLPEWAVERVAHWHDLMDAYAGRTFAGGVYRLHTKETHRKITQVIEHKRHTHGRIPDCEFFVFASDWLGRQFAIEHLREWEGEPAIMLLDLPLNHTYEIDETFLTFHTHELVRDPDAACEFNLFMEWAALNADRIPLTYEQIVGYKIPLSLGGQHEVDNLMLTDIDVEFAINEQITRQILDMQEGTSIAGVSAGQE